MKSVKTMKLELTMTELLHLRDLMSILLPSGELTISKSLATIEDRTCEEGALWDKVYDQCIKHNLPVGPSAPDFAVVAMEPPPLSVVPLQTSVQLVTQDNNCNDERDKSVEQ
jgi:hypothetical protein